MKTEQEIRDEIARIERDVLPPGYRHDTYPTRTPDDDCWACIVDALWWVLDHPEGIYLDGL